MCRPKAADKRFEDAAGREILEPHRDTEAD